MRDDIETFGNRLYDGKTLEVCSFPGQHSIYNAIDFVGNSVVFKKRDESVHIERGVSELIVCRPHVVMNLEQDHVLKLVRGAGKYNIDVCIKFNNTKGLSALSVLVEDGCVVGELGVRFGATARYMLENHKEIKKYYCFELDPIYCEFLENSLEDKRVSILRGDAAKTLPTVPDKLDLVYFDAAHIYEFDKPVLDSLLPKLKPESNLVFDDYNLDDVKRLVDEYIKGSPICDVYYADDRNNRLIRLFKHGG